MHKQSFQVKTGMEMLRNLNNSNYHRMLQSKYHIDPEVRTLLLIVPVKTQYRDNIKKLLNNFMTKSKNFIYDIFSKSNIDII